MRTLLLSLLFALILFPCAGQIPAQSTPAALAKSYEAAAAATFASGDYEKSMEFFSKAFPYLQKDPALIDSPGVLLTHAVSILIQQQLPSEALGILRAIDIPAVAAKHDNIDPEQMILAKGDCFYAMNEPDSAGRYYREAMRYVPNPGFSKYKVVAYETLANFYTGTRQYAKARPLLDTLTAAANRGITPLATQTTAYFRLYQADSATQNHREALLHFRQYQLLQDTLAAIGKGHQLAEMDSLFETEKRTQRAADQAAQAGLQTQLAQSAHSKNILLTAAVLLLLALLAILFSRYQLHRRLTATLATLEQNKQTHEAEKEQLRREIHQRTLNQLDTTITLLRTSAGRENPAIPGPERPKPPPPAEPLKPLSLAHKKLSAAAANTTNIDMREYIRELIGMIRESLPLQRPIVWRLDLAAIDVDSTQCIPLGLLLEEAITNAIRHAFCSANGASPTIHISLKEVDNNSLILLIADNGTGLPAGVNPAKCATFGFRLIQTLSRQLEGTAEFSNKDGFTIRIRYKYR